MFLMGTRRSYSIFINDMFFSPLGAIYIHSVDSYIGKLRLLIINCKLLYNIGSS